MGLRQQFGRRCYTRYTRTKACRNLLRVHLLQWQFLQCHIGRLCSCVGMRRHMRSDVPVHVSFAMPRFRCQWLCHCHLQLLNERRILRCPLARHVLSGRL